ncbi:lycopene cyclase domain-containing protein [Amnibacterium flavum]|uniref:Lycopene cyclase n=1 Tax=Amnibacterium flavum TaxID=2173173 RepID=A0A2V1HS34_9MICO|nr:lycopene cyclase domain-containing protein [Amnibacterium flavum]PVZ95436.1 lycopene cyclase [Amnibacterium flavum]
MTYLLINAPFLLLVLLVAVAAVLRERDGRARRLRLLALTTAAVVLATAVFDNVIIGLGIVAYDSDHVSGIRIGLAPIEDFAYAVAAGLGLPALWLLLPARRATA